MLFRDFALQGGNPTNTKIDVIVKVSYVIKLINNRWVDRQVS